MMGVTAWRSRVRMALLAVVVLVASRGAVASDSTEYEIVSTVKEDGSAVAVVRRSPALFLLYDATTIGAEFDDPYLRQQAAFPGFAIMQCVAYLNRDVKRAMQVGLGIGTVPSFLRAKGIPTDVVEISDAVVTQATGYFQYERCERASQEEEEGREAEAGGDGDGDDKQCVNGETFITDGLAFIHDQTPRHADAYDAFIIDVYTGWNPVAFFVREVLADVRDKWLTPRGDGVLVLNFVGLINGPEADVPKSIYRTLQSLFTHVKCFREIADEVIPDDSNIVFFASNAPFKFNVPNIGEYRNPEPNTYFNAIKNFQKWEIFKELQEEANVEVQVSQSVGSEEVDFMAASSQADSESRVQVLTNEDHGQEIFREIHAGTKARMRQRIIDQFPTSMWEELGVKVE